MRIITWNIHGAKKESPAWKMLFGLHPDIVLLQEVGHIPELIADVFDLLSRPATSKTGKPQRVSTAVLVRGKQYAMLLLARSIEMGYRSVYERQALNP